MSIFGDALNDMLTGDIGHSDNVRQRQNSQWEAANAALTAAGTALALEEPNYEAAIAAALTGLLALKLSDS